MLFRHLQSLPLALLGACALFSATAVGDAHTSGDIVIDDGSDALGAESELVIEGGDAIGGDEISIDAGDPGSDGEISIEDTAPDAGGEISIDGDVDIGGGDELMLGEQAPADDADDTASTLRIGLDEARIEFGHFPDGGSTSENAYFGHLSASANWQPAADWEVQLAGRVDGFKEDDDESFSTVRGDYGDSFIRYRGDNVKLTFGSQTVIWGRLDELPLSDRVSTVDLTRGPLDDLEYRRRSTPMLRAEAFVGGGKLDLAWLYDFREAELPDRDSVWYPVDQRRGRLLGIDPDDLPATLVSNADIDDDEPSGDGGFGARYTRTHSFADIGVTAARVRQSTPYFRAANGGTVLQAEYPRAWIVGADAAVNAADATWRVEVVYNSDSPVTRSDLRYDTVAALQWGAGVEFHPGDSDSRVNLQLIGTNLIDAPRILDRSEIYSLTGEIEIPFDRERWRADVDLYIGLDDQDVYVNPEIAFLGWEPHELYLAMYFFDGHSRSIGGFYEDQSVVTLGWRAKF